MIAKLNCLINMLIIINIIFIIYKQRNKNQIYKFISRKMQHSFEYLFYFYSNVCFKNQECSPISFFKASNDLFASD